MLIPMLVLGLFRPVAQPPTDTLTLTAAIARGRERAVVATLARLNARVAETRVGQRRADLLPSLSVVGAVNRQTRNLDEFGIPFASGVTDPFSIFTVQLRASQTLFDWAAFARLRAAKDSVVAAGSDVETAGAIAGTTAGIAFLRALSAQETVAAREADSAIATRLLDQARQLEAAGLTPAIDLTRSQVNLAAVRSQLVQARNQRDRGHLDLARALDLPLDSTLTLASLPAAGGDPLPSDPAPAAGFALEHRSELRAERQRLAVLETSRRAIRAEGLPSLVATGSYGQSGRETDRLNGSYLAQLGLSIPILDGFRRPLRSRELAIRIEAQSVRIRDLEQQVAAEARQALLDLATAGEQVTLASERIRLAEAELAQAEERFRAGVAGSIETTNAQTGLVAARDQLIQARVGLAIARVSAYRALGILGDLR